MKGTDTFKKTIQDYLSGRAVQDPLFAESMLKADKNIDDCITYIINQVKSSGNNGFEDEEIFNMAVHYYDEENIEAGEPISGVRIVSNHHVELTQEEQEEARNEAKERLIREQINSMKPKSKPKPPTQPTTKTEDNPPFHQLSLF